MVKSLALALLLAALSHPALAHGDMEPKKAAKPPRPPLGTSVTHNAEGEWLAVSVAGQQVVLQRSRDGREWSAPTPVNARPEAISADGENRPKIAVLRDGGVLVTWSQALPKRFTGLVRAAHSADGGKSFGTPYVVHRDRQEIGHSFDTLLVAGERVYVSWIDKRDGEAAKAANRAYRGSAIYVAVSTDGGRSFQAEKRVADHSCECCRIAAATDRDGQPLLFWRHVFEPNVRDHALTKLAADGTAAPLARATFDGWRVDGCPHHGPALAIAEDGTRHAVWFNQKDGEGRAFYGRLAGEGGALRVEGQRPVGGERAAHADIAVAGARVAIVWKEFDGESTRLRAELSNDGGKSFSAHELAASVGASDQPRALVREGALYAFWRSEKEGLRLFELR